MINSIKSIRLRSISPVKNNISFDQDLVPDEEIDIKFLLKGELSVDKEKKSDKCQFIFMAVANSSTEDNVEIFNIELAVEYIFSIEDKKIFHKINEEGKASLCSHLVFLDFRRRLGASFSGIGLPNIRLPLSLEQFSDMENTNNTSQ